MPQFCNKILGVEYKAFRSRIRQGRLRLSEIKLILIYTNVSFEELFLLEDVPTAESPETPESQEPQEPTPEKPPKQEPPVPPIDDYIDSY